jgi:AcrR family transcriptional regulator
MTERDPARGLELLWGVREPPRRGPRPKLAVRDVVRAAVELADAEGLAALSMRRVGDRLGVAAMSVYTYVPGRTELVDLMVDEVYGELSPPAGRTWRKALDAVARANHALCLRHPWLLEVVAGRPALGPNAMAKYESELRAIDGAGLSDVEMDSVLTLLAGHVHASAYGAVEAARAVRSSGVTDQEWWEARAPILERVFDPERFPLAVRVGSVAGAAHQSAYDPEHAFEFGLSRILDGVQALVDGRR